MKLIKIILFFALLPTFLINAQVGIGTTNPNALLDIRSSNEATPANTDGMLIPKIDEYPATNPTISQDGMLVYATGDGSVSKGFYYWDNGTTSWVSFSGSGSSTEKIDDLTDGKSDNDGSDNGSSIFIGVDAGLNDDGSDNMNVGVGFESLKNNTTGELNTANGYQSLLSNLTGSSNTANGISSLKSNTTGSFNTANGYVALSSNLTGSSNTANGINSLQSNTTGSSNTSNGSNSMLFHTTGSFNVANGAYSFSLNTIGSKNVSIGSFSLSKNIIGNNNTAVGYNTGYNATGSDNIFIGFEAGYNETNSNRLFIENSNSVTPLIYGEFDNDLLRVNGDFEVEKTVDAGITVLTPFGYKSSLKLFESGGSGDYGFEFEYDGSPDKFYLWSRTFVGNEGIRMTWLKNGHVGISTTSPSALLDVSSTDPTAPKNTDGMLVPRVDAFPSTNPGASQNGMLVFLTTDNTFYFWKNSSTTWAKVNIDRINDLVDGKSDNDGTNDGSSIFLGINAGANDNETNNHNVGIGYNTMTSNTSGSYNTAIGFEALESNTSGVYNSAFGSESLNASTSGSNNSAFGRRSLMSTTTGYLNTAIGNNAMENNTTSHNNVAIGFKSLLSGVGNYNVSIGNQALQNNNSDNNVAVGYQALYNNSSSKNTAIGNLTLINNSNGYENTAIGYSSLNTNSVGVFNVGVGVNSLLSNTIGYKNVAIGNNALDSNTNADFNTAVGYDALSVTTTGNFNTALGANSGPIVTSIGNTTSIGYGAQSTGSNQVRLGNSSVSVIGGYAPWSNFSDKRIKTNIKEDIVGLEFIKKLRPVSYNLDMDAIARFEKTPDKFRLKEAERLKAKEVQTGFIAQEVEAAAKEVGFNFHGVVKPYAKDDLYALSYSEFVVPLVKAVQEQQEEIEALKKELAEIKALLTNK